MFLVLAGLLFAAFVINLLMGALMGTPPMGIVSEMLVLFAASIGFVIAILGHEAQGKSGHLNEIKIRNSGRNP